jgi:hypothetical protein
MAGCGLIGNKYSFIGVDKASAAKHFGGFRGS